MSQNAITLTSGMRKNLFSLQNTNTLLERTQKRMATGLRVQTAVDDPVNYFTGLAHRQRAEDLGARKDEMAESIQTVMAGNEGVTAITSLIASAKSLAQSALSSATEDEVTTLQNQYNEVLSQIDQLVTDSGYKGVNLLGGTDVTHEVKFNEDGSSKLTMTGFDATAEGLGIFGAGDDYEQDVDAIAATATTGSGEAYEITWTAADPGAAGNDLNIIILAGAADSDLGVTVSGNDITIQLQDGSGNGSNDVDSILALIANDEGASALISGEYTGGGDSSAVDVVAQASLDFADGADATTETVTGEDWWADGGVNKDVINVAIQQLDTARTTLRTESQKLSTNLSTITIRQDFTKGMINTLEDGAAELTNADMNEEGANMLMLQTRQSLGTTSLSLASQAAQSVLRLF